MPSRTTTALMPRPSFQARATQLHPEPRLDARRGFQNTHLDTPFFEKQSETANAASAEVSFGSFQLFPAQFLLLEDGKPVCLGSRALEILIALVERAGELVSKEELMARVWPNVFVEPANLTVHMSALRRTLRDGRDGNRFIINIPGRGYSFVTSVKVSRHDSSARATSSKKAGVRHFLRPLEDGQVAF